MKNLKISLLINGFILILVIPLDLNSQDKNDNGRYIGPFKDGNPPSYYLKVKDVGHFGDHTYTTSKVINDNQAIVHIKARFYFILSDLKNPVFQDIADGVQFRMEGEWKVMTTFPYKGRTYYFVEASKGSKIIVK